MHINSIILLESLSSSSGSWLSPDRGIPYTSRENNTRCRLRRQHAKDRSDVTAFDRSGTYEWRCADDRGWIEKVVLSAQGGRVRAPS
jgi:hypothetical protein